MFIANLTYIAPIERIEALLEEHKAFLQEYYAQGVFLASGRKNPRNGGIILARCASREALEKILAQDPFQIHQAAEYEIIEFIPSFTAEGLESLQEML